MSRVELIGGDDAPIAVRRWYGTPDPGAIVRSLAHVPELADVALPFINAVLGASSIGARTKEIVIVRTSALQRCTYCVTTHAAIGLSAGLSAEEVRALLEPGPAEAFPDPAERALIAWVDAVAVGPGEVPAELLQDLRMHVGEAELVELTMVVGATLMLNRYATALELPPSGAARERLRETGVE